MTQLELIQNYERIKEGKDRRGNQTYLLQLKDKHNNTLIVELSSDRNYWNINTAGIFKESYGKNRKEVYRRHTTAKQSAGTVEASQETEQSGTPVSSSMVNAHTTSQISPETTLQTAAFHTHGSSSSDDKGSEKSPETNELGEKVAVAEAETATNPTEGQFDDAAPEEEDAETEAAFSIGDGEMLQMTDSQWVVYETVMGMLDDAGVPVEIVSEEQMQELSEGEATTLQTGLMRSLSNAVKRIQEWVKSGKRGASFTLTLPSRTLAMVRNAWGKTMIVIISPPTVWYTSCAIMEKMGANYRQTAFLSARRIWN